MCFVACIYSNLHVIPLRSLAFFAILLRCKKKNNKNLVFFVLCDRLVKVFPVCCSLEQNIFFALSGQSVYKIEKVEDY